MPFQIVCYLFISLYLIIIGLTAFYIAPKLRDTHDRHLMHLVSRFLLGACAAQLMLLSLPFLESAELIYAAGAFGLACMLYYWTRLFKYAHSMTNPDQRFLSSTYSSFASDGDDQDQPLLLRRALEKEVEQRTVELMATNATYRQLLDTINDYVLFRMSLTGEILSWNAGGTRIAGYVSKEIVGANFSILFSAEDRALGRHTGILSEMRIRSRLEYRGWTCRKHGSHFWAETIISAVKVSEHDRGEFVVVMRDLTAQKLEEDERSRRQAQLRGLAIRQESIRERERGRIARELHDELGQALTVFKMGLTSMLSLIANAPSSPQLFQINLHVQEMIQNLDFTIKNIRRIAIELRPPILDSLGLIAALEWHIDELSKTALIDCRFQSDIAQFDGTSEQAITLYRAAQEFLTNVIRHAKARTVSVTLTKQSNLVSLEAQDDGIGIKEDDLQRLDSFGLFGLSERLSALSGSLKVERCRTGGTRAIASIPLHAETTQEAHQ